MGSLAILGSLARDSGFRGVERDMVLGVYCRGALKRGALKRESPKEGPLVGDPVYTQAIQLDWDAL